MKDDTSTPTPDRSSPNEFERGKPGSADRSRAEAAIEELRQRGGVFVEAVRATRMPMALTDPNLPGNPIVFANEAFLKLSGYGTDEVLGQQPHFLNGPTTDPRDAARFAEALRSDQDDIIETVQYRKDGSRFVATVLLSAFKDDHGHTLNHVLSYLDVTRRVDAEEEVADLRAAGAVLAEDLRNTKILQDVGGRLTPEGDIQTIYEEILSAAIEITEARAGTVQMLDPSTGELVVLAARGFAERTRDSLSAQSTPLVSRSGKLIGMISTHWDRVDQRASERRLRFLDLLARQAADLLEQRAAAAALRESERYAQTLVAELQHRVRNMLGVVRSIAQRTAENSDSVEDMLAHFQGRLDAFSRVQAVLTRNPDALVDLRSLIDDELVAHVAAGGMQVQVEGPDIALEGKAAERLSLAIHELTTNAVKHGALMNGKGRIRITWRTERVNGSRRLVLNWSESGVELGDAGIERRGFGMELLCESLPYDLHGETELRLTLTGLEFELRMLLPSDKS